MIQYHGGSPDKQRVLILAPIGVASINVSGITIQSALSIPCRGKFYPLDCNSITSLRNKFSEVQLIIIDEISMVSKKLFYQIHQRLVEIFNVPNILSAGKSVLVVGDLYQLPPVNAMPVYASSNSAEPKSYVAYELWKMFRLVELMEVMRHKGDTSFIYLLNQIRVGNIDESSEMIIQSRFIDGEDSNYPKQALHIFAENAPVSTHNDTMLNQLSGLPIEIKAIDIVPSNCGFTGSDIIAAQNHKPSDTGGLAKSLILKLEAKVMLAVNVDVQDRLINGQIGVVKHLEIIENKVSIIYIKFDDDPDAGKKLITKNSTVRIHNWVEFIIGFQSRDMKLQLSSEMQINQ